MPSIRLLPTRSCRWRRRGRSRWWQPPASRSSGGWPRGHWPVEELVKRCAETLDNPVVLDRRIQDLAPASRMLLAARLG